MKTNSGSLSWGQKCKFPAIILFGALSAQSHAVTIVQDDFSSNSQGDWIRRGATTGTPAGGASFGGGEAVLTVASDNANTQAIYHTFSTTTLANDGDYLLLTTDVKVSWGASNGGAPRIGLGYANAAFSDDVSTTVPIEGYNVRFPSNGNSTDPTFAWVSNGANFFNPTAGQSDGAGQPSLANTFSLNSTYQTITMRIERSGSGFLFSGSLGGGAFGPTAVYTDNVPAGFQFNTLGLSVQNFTGQTATYDNVSLVSNIPEPGGATLLGLAGTLLLLRRRK